GRAICVAPLCGGRWCFQGFGRVGARANVLGPRCCSRGGAGGREKTEGQAVGRRDRGGDSGEGPGTRGPHGADAGGGGGGGAAEKEGARGAVHGEEGRALRAAGGHGLRHRRLRPCLQGSWVRNRPGAQLAFLELLVGLPPLTPRRPLHCVLLSSGSRGSTNRNYLPPPPPPAPKRLLIPATFGDKAVELEERGPAEGWMRSPSL
ncbi:unnamed protein product, partial [Scytosiphon promiscuus]